MSRICLGSMYFGVVTPEDESIRLMRRALDAGISFWDSSNMYQDGRAEEVVGKGLAEPGVRDQVVLATKVFYPRAGQGPNDRGAGRRHLVMELDNQLRRLNTDWIDIYYLHRSDFETPLEETIETLDGFVRKGKIRYWGMSTFPAWRMAEAWWRADRRGWVPPLCEQAPYNLVDRRLENERLPFIKEYGLGLMTWSSLGGGLLSGKYTSEAKDRPPEGTRLKDQQARWAPRLGESGLPKAAQLAELSRSAGIDPVHFSISWLLAQEGLTATVVGPRTLDQLEGYFGAFDVTLGEDVLAEIDRIVPPGSAVADFHDTSGWYVGQLTYPEA